MSPKPLLGIVLAGGSSARMGRDKALIDYHGLPQWQHCAQLLDSFCDSVYISKNRQQTWKIPAHYSELIDSETAEGPFHPWYHLAQLDANASWLIITCDLPYLNSSCIDFLIKHRSLDAEATCFQVSDENFPDPQITLLSHIGAQNATEAYRSGTRSPRRFLQSIQTHTLLPPDSNWLQSANTPGAAKAARSKLSVS